MSVELARRAAAGDLAPDVVDWLGRGFARHLAGDDLAQSLCLDRCSRVRARDRALRDAAAILNTNDYTPWQLAGILAKAIKRFTHQSLI